MSNIIEIRISVPAEHEKNVFGQFAKTPLKKKFMFYFETGSHYVALVGLELTM